MKNIYLLLITLLTFHFNTLSQGCLPEGITFSTQQQIDNFQINYPGCTEIEGNVLINGENISDLNGLLVIKSIGNDLEIGECFNLSSLHGLDSLNLVGGDLRFWSNLTLTNLDGLNALTNIGERFFVYDSENLKNFIGLEALTSIGKGFEVEENKELESFIGLNSLDSIGLGLTILQNPKLEILYGLESLNHLNGLYIVKNNSLPNLDGLEVLESIGLNLSIYQNTSLQDLSGLENTNLSTIIEMHIVYNDLLSACGIQSLCNYLSNPNGYIEIDDNAPGCNSQEEVEESCPMGLIEKVIIGGVIQIFPNPAKKTISIESASQTKILEIKIFNQTGNLSIEENNPENKIDVSNLQPGLYFVEIKTEAGIVREKLIIQ